MRGSSGAIIAQEGQKSNRLRCYFPFLGLLLSIKIPCFWGGSSWNRTAPRFARRRVAPRKRQRKTCRQLEHDFSSKISTPKSKTDLQSKPVCFFGGDSWNLNRSSLRSVSSCTRENAKEKPAGNLNMASHPKYLHQKQNGLPKQSVLLLVETRGLEPMTSRM